MKHKSIDELKSGGYSEGEIAEMLSIPLVTVYNHLSGVESFTPEVSESDSDTDDLKTELKSAATEAIRQMKSNIKNNKDAVEVSKMADSIAKTFTAFFKEEKGTTVNIMQTNLSMFKDSLKR